MSESLRGACTILGLMVVGVACLPIDLPLSRWLLADVLSGDIRAIFHRVEVFGHG